jgi:hypothetical protein
LWARVVAVFNFLNVPLDVPLSEPEFSKNQRIARINRKTGLRYLITNVGFGGARKYALIVQRSLIKEYEPRRKIYGMFYKIDIAPFLKGAISIVAV